MFCQICGSKLRSSARFCNMCGKPVEERFGSALLQQPVIAPAPTTPELRAPAAQAGELHARIHTDQIPQRSTERQPSAPTTAEESSLLIEIKPSVARQTTTGTEALPPPEFAFQPPPRTTLAEPRKPTELSTEHLQRGATGKPFFTQMLTPRGVNRQHKHLVYAVPLVLLAVLLVFIFAYIAAK